MDDEAATLTRDIFVVCLLLVAVAYFVGFSTDATTVIAALKSLIYAATGRDNSGQFAGYPGGATLAQNSATGTPVKTTTL